MLKIAVKFAFDYEIRVFLNMTVILFSFCLYCDVCALQGEIALNGGAE